MMRSGHNAHRWPYASFNETFHPDELGVVKRFSEAANISHRSTRSRSRGFARKSDAARRSLTIQRTGFL